MQMKPLLLHYYCCCYYCCYCCCCYYYCTHEDEAGVGRIRLEGEGVEHSLRCGGRATLHVAHLALDVVDDVHEAGVERLEVGGLEEARLLRLTRSGLRGGQRLMQCTM